MPTRRAMLAAAATLPVLRGSHALAQSGSPKRLRIGILNDQSSLYADMGGPGSAVAARLAIADADLMAKGWTAGVLVADHRNKPDIASSIARQWFDTGVDAVADTTNSAVALAGSQIARERNKALFGMFCRAGHGELDDSAIIKMIEGN